MSYLLDKDFMAQLYGQKNINSCLKIYLLDFSENIKEIIEGKTISCNINIDGNSSLRRTCSLSLSAIKDLNFHKEWWGIHSKIKVEIGIDNQINSLYPKTIWIPLGIYIVDSFSKQEQVNSISISITGKDKMVQLNGTAGGYFGQQTVLDKIEIMDKEGNINREKRKIKDIIIDIMHLYGGEQLYNLQLEEIDKMALKMVKYQGENPYYLAQPWRVKLTKDTYNSESKEFWEMISIDSETWIQFTDMADLIGDESNKNEFCFYYEDYKIFSVTDYKFDFDFEENKLQKIKKYLQNSGGIELTQDNINSLTYNIFEQQSHLGLTTEQPLFIQIIYVDENNYQFIPYFIYKIEQGDIAGYQLTDMVYSDDFVMEATDTVTAALDKIITFLGGEYEYFYDINGKFIFRKKAAYSQISYNPYDFYLDGNILVGKNNQNSFISIEDKKLISNIKFTPALDNIKNDFIVWGQKSKSTPICLRYAIDEKPTSYNPIRFDEVFKDEIKESANTNLNLSVAYNYNDGVDKIALIETERIEATTYANYLHNMGVVIKDGGTYKNYTQEYIRTGVFSNKISSGFSNIYKTTEARVFYNETDKKTYLRYQFSNAGNNFHFIIQALGKKIFEDNIEEGPRWYMHFYTKKNKEYIQELKAKLISANYEFNTQGGIEFDDPEGKVYEYLKNNSQEKDADDFIRCWQTYLDLDSNYKKYVELNSDWFDDLYFNWSREIDVPEKITNKPKLENDVEATTKYEKVVDLGVKIVYPYDSKNKCIYVLKPDSIFNNTDYGYDLYSQVDKLIGKYFLFGNISYHKIISVEKRLMGGYKVIFNDPYNYLKALNPYDVNLFKYTSAYESKDDNILSIIEPTEIQSSVIYQDQLNYNSTVDWRELIYQMALDYRKCGQHDQYAIQLQKYNPWCINGKTGYEQYYTDLIEFWPQYYRFLEKETVENTEEKVNGVIHQIKTITTHYKADWNYEALEDLSKIKYWLEFVGENNSELQNLTNKKIGIRANVLKDENITQIYEIPVPNICYISPDQVELKATLSFPYCQVQQNFLQQLQMASYEQAAINSINSLFFSSIKNNKNLDITMMPNYTLEPNTILKVKLEEDEIYGNYVIEKISYNLTNSFNMTISSTLLLSEY